MTRSASTPAYCEVVSRRPEREAIEADQPRRSRVWQWLVDNQPTDPLQRLAYWTAIRDGADEQIVTAGAAARDAEHTWHAIGMAYGDRTAQAAFKRFGNA
jgi:hypothetical protein